ncbi:MAG: 3-phosphoserine/phosphohydroxythreonine transaminase [Myxococcales bacterium]|nr:3-phosphoserine/phosphohydroxythreonine transaminase [Myxococcales bacterium]MCB9652280.1 3-phosphoserine/phosphohydroxythreonine transaminase [Deltaproteobacteria bacterium]
MARDIVNFNAGPAGLPTAVLERAQAELMDFQGTGMSIMEHSHRGKAYDAVHNEAMSLTRSLMGVPDSYDVLFLQGGASGMFATIPMNFLTAGKVADYVITGTWSQKAIEEAQRIGEVRVAGTGKVGERFVRIPEALDLTPGAAYVHVTSNNTIAGTQYRAFPKTEAPLVADMSSDIMSRPVDVSQFSLLYAGAQKNLGPSGVVLVLVRRDWLAQASTTIPKIFRFKTHADKQSLYHTPPTFAIYLMRNVMQWIGEHGGLEGMAKRNAAKAEALYAAIDASGGFYASDVEVAARSEMNVVWRLPSEDLDKAFVAEATAAGLVGLKGHRDVGGIRASLYNAVELAGVERLVTFMKDFKNKR